MQLSWQATLPGWDASPALSYLRLVRLQLDSRSWVDHCPGWLTDADELMAELVRTSRWSQRERRMYDAMVMSPGSSQDGSRARLQRRSRRCVLIFRGVTG
jgi:hypothetical protein